ncbi:aminodeoxychorismate synthase component I [Sphingomonas sp. BK345]|uniref:aminodeoxychorismate synthase component I n=1 Tax=Sphingomonas sp. BK345 TaxID=2586980 RepID=UPI0016156ABB|nr:aminodeoxychorismate synthase component I [Sphingomonas sp. BK345]MBB3473972.1 para-aminobenzoate synthetase/4-amino-4-deoxychorismate lyase [Sphingomonas sp. BK345]
MVLEPPFVLLDDARPGAGPARLYTNPRRVLRTDTLSEVPAVLREAAGSDAAGFLSYAAGAAFEPSAGGVARADGAPPLAWFGLFDGWQTVNDVAALLPEAAASWVGAPEPEPTRDDYDAMFAQAQALIAAGDLYQLNLTFRARVPVLGDPLALYARLRPHARAGWGAIVATGEHWLLSFSPELFVALDGDRLTCRPMKGTARRESEPAADRAAAERLAADPKQRAENLMIVDLMRNDLARVASPGSVAVPALFAVEHYPSVHQLTSTVTAALAPGCDAADVLAALFPCGSITGAPKVRAMQAIAAIERGSARDVYTGAIGRIDAGGDAQFSVAIRTLTLAAGADAALLGVGGGIVADSRADEEWDEALAKAAFVARAVTTPDLIETIAFDPLEGLLLVDRHLARMKASAAALGFGFDRHAARNELQAATFRLRERARVRLLLAPSGAIAIEVTPPPMPRLAPLRVALAPLPVTPQDWRLRHKTSDRGFYDRARRAAGADEVVFIAPDGCLTEGSFTTVFVERGETLVTPRTGPLLPGVLRAELIAQGRAIERDLTPDDLAGGFLLGNALRGLMPATLAVAQ